MTSCFMGHTEKKKKNELLLETWKQKKIGIVNGTSACAV